MSAKVWVIEDGEYSDYHVVGVFSSRENAELILSKLNSGEISEWDLDPAIEAANAGLSRYYVQMLRDGTVLKVEAMEFDTEQWDYINPDEHFEGTAGLRVYIFAKDEQHAIKITNEKRLQAIACGKWDAQ